MNKDYPGCAWPEWRSLTVVQELEGCERAKGRAFGYALAGQLAGIERRLKTFR